MTEQKKKDASQEQATSQGTRDDGRTEGTATKLDAGLPGREPGDGEGGMGDHMGAGEFGNGFGRYGGTRTRPEDTKQNANADQLDDAVAGTATSTPPDTRAADDTLGGYGGVAGGKDFRPEQQRKKDKGRST